MPTRHNRFFIRALFLGAIATCFSAALPVAATEGPVKKATKRARGRLPAYYSQVVTEEQRQKIYQIQEDYRPKLDALDTQRKAMLKERDEKIAAILTPEQKKHVEEAAAMARQKPIRQEQENSGKPAKDLDKDTSRALTKEPAK